MRFTYLRYDCSSERFSTDGDYAPASCYDIPPSENNSTLVRDLAYNRLVSRLADESQWGANLLEARSGLDTMVRSVNRLRRAVRHVKRGNVRAALNDLSVPEGRRGPSSRVKSAADLWLEYQFFWAPTIRDVYAAVDTMSRATFGTRLVYGNANALAEYTLSTGNKVERHRVRDCCKTGARVRISNPNAFLANQMGLVNPASIAWEIIPFSFVVDWFVNVGDCLSAMTDFVGLSIEDSFTTVSREEDVWATDFYQDWSVTKWRKDHWHRFWVDRYPYLQPPTLTLKPFRGFSVARGTNAIALLIQSMR